MLVRALRICVSLAVCLALAACSKQPTPGRALCPGCNVVLISMDTVRADHLSAYGYERKTSPNVDRLAEQSALFQLAVSQSSWTLPAHGAMMTGLYPGKLGVIHYPAKRKLPSGVAMLAEEFQSAGYATSGFVGGGFVSAHFGFGRGFEVYSSDGRRFEHNLDEALPWLERNKDRRFFLFLHGYNAHRPYYSLGADKVAMGLPRKAPVERRGFCMPDNRERPRDLGAIVKYYDAAIHHGDRQVGRFLDRLRELGLMDDTVVLVTADHGEEFFEHGNCDHVRFLYREVVNVPYILYVPGLTPHGRQIDQIVPASISVPRTLLDIVGVQHSMPGPTLEPLLRGQSVRFDAVYSEADSIAGKLGSRGATIAVTTPQHKLIEYTEEGSDEAYDIQRDPYEQRILPPEHDAYAKRQTLRSWHLAQGPLPPPSVTARVAKDEAASKPDAKSRAELAKSRAREARKGRPTPDRAAARPAPPRAATAKPSPPANRDDDEQEEIPAELREHLRSLGYVD